MIKNTYNGYYLDEIKMLYLYAAQGDLYLCVQPTEVIGPVIEVPPKFSEEYEYFIDHQERDNNPFLFLNFLGKLKECIFPRREHLNSLGPYFDFFRPDGSFESCESVFDTDTHGIKNLMRGFSCSFLDFWKPDVSVIATLEDCANALYNMRRDPWNCVNITVFLIIFSQPKIRENAVSYRIKRYRELHRKELLMSAALLVLMNKNEIYVNVGLNVLCLLMTNFYNKRSILIGFCAELFASHESERMMRSFAERLRREGR